MSDVPTMNEASPELEEACEPLAVLPPARLEPGEIVTTPDGSKLVVARLVKADPLYHVYEVTWLPAQGAQVTSEGEEARHEGARAQAATSDDAPPLDGEAPAGPGIQEREGPTEMGIEPPAGVATVDHADLAEAAGIESLTEAEREGPADAGTKPPAGAGTVAHADLAEGAGLESPTEAGRVGPADAGIEPPAGDGTVAHADLAEAAGLESPTEAEREGPADAGIESRAGVGTVAHADLATVVEVASPADAGPGEHDDLERGGPADAWIESPADATPRDRGDGKVDPAAEAEPAVQAEDEAEPKAEAEPAVHEAEPAVQAEDEAEPKAEALPGSREGAEGPGPAEVQAGPEGEEARQGETLWLVVSADPSHVRQMEHAFDVLSALESPGTPTVHHIFPLGAQTCLVGEALEGDTLADAMARGTLDTRGMLSVVARAALAVSRLHEQGWLHLALRPEAILLLEGPEQVKLLDFSRAVRVGTCPAAPFHLPGYSAPELASGGAAGPQADVYGLGALLYRLLCGTSIPETGPELRAGRLPCGVAGVPQILVRCLDMDPERRYQAASYLHRDLLRLLWRMRPGVTHHVEGATTIGLDPGRGTNQDSWGFLSGRLQSEERTSTWSVFCVADGMGGMEAGDVASRMAVSTLLSGAASLTQRRECFDGEEQLAMLRRWTMGANERVVEALQGLGVRGGTTLVCGFVVDRRMVLGHVGDSRAYLFRQGKCAQLTRDHSLAMMMILQGQASLDEIRTNPDRNRVTRSLGDRHPLPDWYVDSLQTITGNPVLELEPDDVVVLCSDGVWEPVIEEQMERILAEQAGDPAEAVSRLLAHALAAGAPDNATVVIFQALTRPSVSTPSPRKDSAPACSTSS